MTSNDLQSRVRRIDGEKVRNLVVVIMVALAAAAVRAGYLADYRLSPFFTYLFLDSLWHQQWAQTIAGGDWAGSGVFFRAPLYPYFLGLIHYVSGGGPLAPRLVQFGLGSVSAALVCLLGLHLFQRRGPALAAGLGFALYGPMIYFEGELLIPSLIVFLDLLGLWLLLRAGQGGRKLAAAGGGLALGLSVIARPTVIPAALALGAWLFVVINHRGRRRALVLAAVFAALLAVPSLLVMARNGAVGGIYTPLPTQGGVNFYIGNNPAADGKTAVAVGLETAAGPAYVDNVMFSSRVVAERELGRELTPVEVSDFWYGKSWDWLTAEPGAALSLFGRKLFYLFHGHEIPSNNVPYFARRYSRALGALMWDRGLAFPAGVLFPLAAWGMVLAWPDRRRWAPLYLFTAAYSLAVAIYFINGRYRMPLIGPCVLFAVLGVLKTAVLVRARPLAGVAAAASMAALLFASNVDGLGVRNDDLTIPWSNLGNYYYESGDLDQAARCYRETLEIQPDHQLALGNLGSIAYLRGELGTAEYLYRRALEANPNQPALHNNLGQVMELKGDHRAASESYQQALALQPDYERARQNLERVIHSRSRTPSE